MLYFAMLFFLFRVILIGLAVAKVFINLGLFKKMTNEETVLIGISSTPMFVSLFDYIMGLIFVGGSSWIFVGVPIIISIVILFYKDFGNKVFEASCNLLKKGIAFWLNDIDFSKITVILFGVIVDILLFSIYFISKPKQKLYEFIINLTQNTKQLVGLILIFAILLVWGILAIRKMKQKGSFVKSFFMFSTIVLVGCGCYMGIATNGRPTVDIDRSHYELEARYFVEDKNSWEIDRYSDEKYGSSLTDDHGPLWVVCLADPKLLADSLGIQDNLRITNFGVFWTFCCFILLFYLYSRYISQSKTAGIISFLMFFVYWESDLMLRGQRDAFRFVGLLLLMLYLCNQLDDIISAQTKWYEYVALALFCFLSMNGHESNSYLMLGMFALMGVYLLVNKTSFKHLILWGSSAFFGTLLGISKTIYLYFTTGLLYSTTALPFHDIPVVKQIAEVDDARGNWSTIWASYKLVDFFVILVGLIGLVTMVLFAIRKKNRKLFFSGILIIGTLLPLTGIMDWMGYECSRWFIEQGRYRMYFLIMFSLTGGWLLTRRSLNKYINIVSFMICVCFFCICIREECSKLARNNQESVEICNEIKEEYCAIADKLSLMTTGDVFVDNQMQMYYLHGTPKLLFHMYSEELIQAKTDEEVQKAINNLNIGAIVLPGDGLLHKDYSLLPFWDYINNRNNAEIIPVEGTLREDGVYQTVIFRIISK